MKLTPPQEKIAQDNHRFRVLCCGRRFGKTILGREEMISLAVSKPSRILYITTTLKQARSIMWKGLKRRLQPVLKSKNESRLEIEVNTKNGDESIILLRGWKKVDPLRGQAFDLIVIDEVAAMTNFWTGWEDVLRPTLTDSAGDGLFISTPKGFNHFYDLYNKENEDDEFTSFKFTSYDNPHIPKEELDKAREQMPNDKFAQEYLADFKKTEGLVYPEFKRELHLFDDSSAPKAYSEKIAGVDFGYTNPTALLSIGIDYDRNYYIYDEFYKKELTGPEIAHQAKLIGRKERINYFYPDCEAPDKIKQLKNAGLNCRSVDKEIIPGIDKIRELFKANKIFIHKRCKNLISELEQYKYPEDKDGHNRKEKPVKENDHAVDALRYAIFNHEPNKSQKSKTFTPKNNSVNKRLRGRRI